MRTCMRASAYAVLRARVRVACSRLLERVRLELLEAKDIEDGDEASADFLTALYPAEGWEVQSEDYLLRRMARDAFKLLGRCWKHSALTLKRKYEVDTAVVLSKLLYGLESANIRTQDARKLDGFHAACCRSLLRIQPSFVSRVSNGFVLMVPKTTGSKLPSCSQSAPRATQKSDRI